MSSRLPDEHGEPIRLLVDRLQELSGRLRRPVDTSRCERLLTEALIDDERGAQVVRDRARAVAVRSSFASARPSADGGLGSELTVLERETELTGERLEDVEIDGVEPRPGTTQLR